MHGFRKTVYLLTLSILALIPSTLKLMELYLGISGLGSSITTVMIVYLLLGALIGDIEYTLVIVFASILLSLPIGAVFLTYPLVSLDLPIDSIYPFILYTFSIKLLPIIILVFIPLCLLSSMIGVMIHDRLLRE